PIGCSRGAALSLFFITTRIPLCPCLFSFTPPPPPEIYTLSLHDALPISGKRDRALRVAWIGAGIATVLTEAIGLCAAAFPYAWLDRKSTRLNSSHGSISYAVFCLKKKKNTISHDLRPQHIRTMLRTYEGL